MAARVFTQLILRCNIVSINEETSLCLEKCGVQKQSVIRTSQMGILLYFAPAIVELN